MNENLRVKAKGKIGHFLSLKLILSLACFMLSLSSMAQQPEKVNISAKDQSIKEVLKAIEEATSYRFFYSNDIGFLNNQISLTGQMTIEELMKTLLKGSNLTYEMTENNAIVITPFPADKQASIVKGIVKDNLGEAIGVSVKLKDTDRGTITDLEGRYSVDVSGISNPILVFSFVGYKTVHIPIGNQKVINVELEENIELLDEVVVVGYGAVRKRDLVGAVDQIDNKILEGRPTPNVSRSLQGAIPNLNISLRDGKPSRAATLNIRGTGSIGSGGGALILIDGVEGDMAQVNPSDIQSISVLKDASSSAIYGARGAFGVILITTKNATKDKTTINYSGSVSINQRTVKPKLVTDGYQWTTGWLDAWDGYYNGSRGPANINNIFAYSLDWYNELGRRSTDPSLERVRMGGDGKYQYFGNTDWHDLFFKDHNMSHEHNLSVSGGNDKSNYYISGRFYDQSGIYKAGNERFKQHNFRAKGEVKIQPWLTIRNNTDFALIDYHQPMLYYSNQLPQRMLEHAGQPIGLETNPDGTWTYSAVLNGWAGFSEGSTFQQEDKFTLKNTTTLTASLLDNTLIVNADYSYLYGRNERTRVTGMYTGYTGKTSTIVVNEAQGSTLQDVRYKTEYQSSNIYADYSPKLGENHTVKILGGWNLEQKKYSALTIKREGLTTSKPSFGLMDGISDDPSVTGYNWSYVGVFFRANYSYQGKYLAEFSGRYDGSSKFPDNSKWGFYPSASLGWRISNEKFMSATNLWMDNLKLRLSYGSMGNGNIDPYQYIDYMSLKPTTVVMGDALGTYTIAPGSIPMSLTWETSTTLDVGIDGDWLGNRLNLVFDWYQRNTTNMFTAGVSLPTVFGTTSPKGNNASLRTRGWELSVGWRDSFTINNKPFNYSIKAMLWDATSIVTKYINPTNSLNKSYTGDQNNFYDDMNFYEGMKIGEIWGYQVEGLFKDQADINAHASQTSFAQSSDKVTRPGDVKIKDLDGNGVINRGKNTVDDPGDMSIIGNTTPRYNYGINIDMDYQNIGLSLFFQGVGKKNWYPRHDSGYFWGQYNRPFGYMLQAHTGSNVYRDELHNFDTAYWPRYASYQTHESTDSRLLTFANDRYMQDVSYLRLKNVTISYTFPNNILSKLHLSGLKVYLTGENLFTWSKLFKYTDNFDPEVINAGDSDFRTSEGDGYSYPMLKNITFGLNVTF